MRCIGESRLTANESCEQQLRVSAFGSSVLNWFLVTFALKSYLDSLTTAKAG
jgi:hypothetical protein